MATRTISTKLAVEGEARYKQAIADCNRELRTLKSELSLVESEFKGNANSMEALTAKGNALEKMHEAQAKRVDTLREALANAERAQSNYADRVSTAQGNIEKYEKALADLAKADGDTTEEQARLTAELDKWKTELENAQAGQEAAGRGVQEWQRQLNNAQTELNYLDSEIDKNNRYLDEAKNSADGCAKSIDEYGKEVKGAGKESESFGDLAKGAVEKLAAALTAAGIAGTVKKIADTLKECAATAATFETAMAKVSTLADTSQISLDELASGLTSLSNETGVAATQLAEAMYQALSAGVETADAIGFVTTATKLSIAGFTESATAVDVLTTAINAYGLAGEDAEKVASMLVKTQDLGKTSVDELAASMGKIIPSAAAYNVGLENLTAAYAQLTKSGTSTKIATTQLSGMLDELASNSSEVAEILEEKTGKSFSDLMGEGKSLGDILGILADTVNGDKTAFSNLWSSSTAGKAAISLLNSGCDEFNQTLEAMETSTGAVERNFDIMAGTTENAQKRMEAAAENVKIAVGNVITPALEGMYELGADALTWVADALTKATDRLDLLSGSVGIAVPSVRDLTEEARKMSDVIKGSSANFDKSVGTIEATASVADRYIGKLEELEATGLKTNEQQKEWHDTLSRLCTLVPDLAEYIDLETDSIKGGTSALRDNTDAWKENAIAQAYQEKLIELEQQRAELEIEAAKREVERADVEKKVTEIETRRAVLLERRKQLEAEASAEAKEQSAATLGLWNATDYLTQEYYDLCEELVTYDAALQSARQGVENYNEAIRQENEAMEAAKHEIDLTEQAVKNLTGAQDDNIPSTENNAAATEEMAAKVEGLAAAIAALEEEYTAAYDAAYQSINSQIGLFEEMDGAAKTSIDSLIATLSGQVDYMNTYAENIQKAMELGVDQGLIQKLSDGSEESAQILAAIVEGGEDQIEALNEQFAKVEEGKENFSDTVARMEDEFNQRMEEVVRDLDKAIQELDISDEAYTIGEDNIQGLINGAAGKVPDLLRQYTEMGYAVAAAYRKASGQASPSKVFKQIGRFDVQGIIEGAEEEKASFEQTYADLATAAKEAYQSALPSRTEEPSDMSAMLSGQTNAIVGAVERAFSGGERNSGENEPVTIIVRSELDGRLLSETVTKYQRQTERARGW